MSLLEDITTRGAEIRTRLREFLARHTYTTDTRTVLVIGAADQALEHHEAVWRLRESKLNGSAAAMIRLVYDAMFRSLWFNAVATDEQEGAVALHNVEPHVSELPPKLADRSVAPRPGRLVCRPRPSGGGAENRRVHRTHASLSERWR
jgi:hypothetical protein